MSQNNNVSPEAVVGWLVLVAIAAAIMFMAAIFAFIALAYTALAIAAWNNPITLWGETVDPDDARAYVFRGLVGAGLAPVLVTFAGLLFQFELNKITEHGWLLIILGGYCLGSLGIEIMIHEEQEKAKAAAAHMQEVLPALPPPPKAPPAPPQREQKEFRFETWDDEEISE